MDVKADPGLFNRSVLFAALLFLRAVSELQNKGLLTRWPHTAQHARVGLGQAALEERATVAWELGRNIYNRNSVPLSRRRWGER